MSAQANRSRFQSSADWYSTRASRVSEPMMISGNASLHSRRNPGTMFSSASTLMINERKSAPNTAPTNEPLPPDSAAPPSTAAAMLFSANSDDGPGFASPIPTDAARNSPASDASTEESTNARQLICSDGAPRRREEVSSSP